MIYFIEAVGAGLLKIGFTDREPEQRLKELQTGCPHKLRLVGTTEGKQAAEAAHHEEWTYLRVTGEWFKIDDRLRGYLWWLEFAKPHAEERAFSEVNDRFEPGGALSKLFDRVAALEERVASLEESNYLLEDQVHRLWKTIGVMNGWPDGVQRPCDAVAVIPRQHQAREYADCRM